MKNNLTYILPLLALGVITWAGVVAHGNNQAGNQANSPHESGHRVVTQTTTTTTTTTTMPLTHVDQAAAVAQGKELMAARCSVCHPAPPPQKHTLSEWPATLNKMAPRAHLQPAERKLIETYLQASLQAKPAQ